VARALEVIARYGVAGTARRASKKLTRLAYLREEHLWYELRPADDRPRRTLEPPLALTVRQESPDAQIWHVVEDEREAFSCWIYRRRTPVLAAAGGWLELPESTVCLEDSVTAPEYRGRGIAPTAWSAIADELSREGVERMVTKVEVVNTPSRKAVEKAGFREVALQRLTRVGGRKQLQIDAYDDVGRLLAEALRR
jgi:RimJ/RimL family protein N-acetyltransferase